MVLPRERQRDRPSNQANYAVDQAPSYTRPVEVITNTHQTPETRATSSASSVSFAHQPQLPAVARSCPGPCPAGSTQAPSHESALSIGPHPFRVKVPRRAPCITRYRTLIYAVQHVASQMLYRAAVAQSSFPCRQERFLASSMKWCSPVPVVKMSS